MNEKDEKKLAAKYFTYIKEESSMPLDEFEWIFSKLPTNIKREVEEIIKNTAP
tara:strand:+ start:487 stop:645 length:159 start_codon:yes stop_codon:yes gene_type:complete